MYINPMFFGLPSDSRKPIAWSEIAPLINQRGMPQ